MSLVKGYGPFDGDPIATREVPAGTTVREAVRELGADPDGTNVRAWVDGVLVHPDRFDLRLRPGERLAVFVRPRDLGVLLVVSLILTAASIAYQAVNAASFEGADQEGDAVQPPRASPTFRGARNEVRKHEPFWKLLGTHRVYPPFLARPYTEVRGGKQFMRLLVGLLGPNDVEDVRIGDTEVWAKTPGGEPGEGSVTGAFAGLDVKVRPGLGTDGPLTIFPSVVADVISNPLPQTFDIAQAGQATTSEWTTVTLDADGATELGVDFNLIDGVKRINENGKPRPWTFNLEIQFKQPSDGDDGWTGTSGASISGLGGRYNAQKSGNYIKLSGQSQTPQLYGFRWPVTASFPGEGWQVRVRRVDTTPDNARPGGSDASSVFGRFRWISAKAFGFGVDPSPLPNVTTVELVVQATDQFSGVVDRLNIKATSLVKEIEDAGGGVGQFSGQLVASNVPAELYAHVLQGEPANQLGSTIGDARLDLDRLLEWKEFTEDVSLSAKMKCNLVVDQQSSVRQVLDRVCRCGEARFVMRDTRFSVAIDKAQATVRNMVTARNTAELTIEELFPRNPPHAYRSRFLNEEKNYQEDVGFHYDDGYNKDGSGGNTKATVFEALDVPGVTTFDQNNIHGRRLIAKRKLRPRRISAFVFGEDLTYEVGDRVVGNHDVPLWGVLPGARVLELKTSMGDVTGVVMDEPWPVDAMNTYSVRFQLSDGSTLVVPIDESATETEQAANDERHVIFSTPQTPPNAPAVGDLGQGGLTSGPEQDLRVEEIEPTRDLTGARVTYSDYDPGVFTADTEAIPSFDSGVSQPVPDAVLAPPAPRIDEIDTVPIGLTQGGDQEFYIDVSLSPGTNDPDGTAAQPGHVPTSRYRAQVRFEVLDVDVDGTILSQGFPADPEEGWITLLDQPAQQERVRYGPFTESLNYQFRVSGMSDQGVVGPMTAAVNGSLLSDLDEPVALLVESDFASSPTAVIPVLRLTWEAVDPFELWGYRVRWRRGGSWSPHQDVPVNTPRFEIQGAVQGTYDFEVYPLGLDKHTIGPVASLTVEWYPFQDFDLSGLKVANLELEGQGNDATFLGRDAAFAWEIPSTLIESDLGQQVFGVGEGGTDPMFKQFRVRVVDPFTASEIHSAVVQDPRYVFRYEDNVAGGGPFDTFRFEVAMEFRNGQVGNYVPLVVRNPAPAKLEASEITLTALPGFGKLVVDRSSVDADRAGLMVWIGSSPGVSTSVKPDVVTPWTSWIFDLPSGEVRYLKVAAYDEFVVDPQNPTAAEMDRLNPSDELSTTADAVGQDETAALELVPDGGFAAGDFSLWKREDGNGGWAISSADPAEGPNAARFTAGTGAGRGALLGKMPSGDPSTGSTELVGTAGKIKTRPGARYRVPFLAKLQAGQVADCVRSLIRQYDSDGVLLQEDGGTQEENTPFATLRPDQYVEVSHTVVARDDAAYLIGGPEILPVLNLVGTNSGAGWADGDAVSWSGARTGTGHLFTTPLSTYKQVYDFDTDTGWSAHKGVAADVPSGKVGSAMKLTETITEIDYMEGDPASNWTSSGTLANEGTEVYHGSQSLKHTGTGTAALTFSAVDMTDEMPCVALKVDGNAGETQQVTIRLVTTSAGTPNTCEWQVYVPKGRWVVLVLDFDATTALGGNFDRTTVEKFEVDGIANVTTYIDMVGRLAEVARFQRNDLATLDLSSLGDHRVWMRVPDAASKVGITHAEVYFDSAAGTAATKPSTNYRYFQVAAGKLRTDGWTLHQETSAEVGTDDGSSVQTLGLEVARAASVQFKGDGVTLIYDDRYEGWDVGSPFEVHVDELRAVDGTLAVLVVESGDNPLDTDVIDADGHAGQFTLTANPTADTVIDVDVVDIRRGVGTPEVVPGSTATLLQYEESPTGGDAVVFDGTGNDSDEWRTVSKFGGAFEGGVPVTIFMIAFFQIHRVYTHDGQDWEARGLVPWTSGVPGFVTEAPGAGGPTIELRVVRYDQDNPPASNDGGIYKDTITPEDGDDMRLFEVWRPDKPISMSLAGSIPSGAPSRFDVPDRGNWTYELQARWVPFVYDFGQAKVIDSAGTIEGDGGQDWWTWIDPFSFSYVQTLAAKDGGGTMPRPMSKVFKMEKGGASPLWKQVQSVFPITYTTDPVPTLELFAIGGVPAAWDTDDTLRDYQITDEAEAPRVDVAYRSMQIMESTR